MRTFVLTSCLVLMAGPAHAFCGFYVAGSDTELFNDATMVVMMRNGDRTILSMRNDYRGPTEDFAMVVPVPTVLSEDNVRTLPAEVFERVETLASPRLVEYWEQDPCDEGTIGYGTLGLQGYGRGGGGVGFGSTAAHAQVIVEAEFAVGEYEIVILSANDSDALETWLTDNEYAIPDGVGEALRPYVESGSKFFVAKVNVDRVTFEDGRAVLSPLRIHYTSDSFSLPIRLGQLNSSGTQDLIVHILAHDTRYEAANYENVTIPTNLDVSNETRERFGEFYAALFDATLAAHPGAVVTEYAWQATHCDPCPGPVVTEADLMTLGADVAGEPAQIADQITPGAPVVVPTSALSSEVVRRVVRRHINELRFCLQSAGIVGGVAELTFEVSSEGTVQNGRARMNGAAEGVLQCLASALQRWTFPEPEGGDTATVIYPMRIPGGTSFGAGGGNMDYVLTRLHYRYGRGELGDDLVFRAAEPIMGGREGFGEESEQSHVAVPSDANNFQGRYIIRHEWEGAIECEEPRRGVWGGRPDQPGTEAETSAAPNTAHAPRGNLALASFVQQSLLELGIANPPPAEDEPEDDPPDPSATEESVEGESGCGCRAVRSARPRGLVALVFVALAFRRRRKSSPPAPLRSVGLRSPHS